MPEKPLACCLADPKYVRGSNLKLLFHGPQESQSIWLELPASGTRVSLAFIEVGFWPPLGDQGSLAYDRHQAQVCTWTSQEEEGFSLWNDGFSQTLGWREVLGSWPG